MKHPRLSLVFATALMSTVVLVGCKKEEPPPPPPVVVEPAPAPMPPAPVAATASVTAVDIGVAVGADGKVVAPTAVFAAKDVITASVTTATSDPAATVAGTLETKWTYQDGQVVNSDSKTFNFTGPGTTNFQISKPDGWPVGTYKLEVSLNGAVVQSKDFEVK